MHAAAKMPASTVNIASETGLQGQNHTIGGGRPAARPLDFVLLGPLRKLMTNDEFLMTEE